MIKKSRGYFGACRAAFWRPGITLVEIMVAMAVMTIGVLGMVGAFKFFNVGVQSAKTRSLANNIAQERIEFLKNKSYYRVLVSTATNDDPNFAPGEMVYDVAPNGQETVNVGGINFIRRVYIRKVNEKPDGTLEYLYWNSPDPGLKEIKVYVVWYERGEWRKLEVRNLRENPARVAESATIRGRVTGSGGTGLADVLVRAQENPSQYAQTDSNGDYVFTIEPGTYTLLATKDGWFPGTLASFGLTSGGAATGKNFTLTQMYTGTISGYAFMGTHLVISQIVGSTETSTGNTEWVEVYNPTTWTWTMAAGLGTGANEEVVISYKEAQVAEIKPDFDYRTTTLAPNKYFLFANTGTVTAAGVTRQADAVYDKDSDWTNQDDVIESGAPSSGGYVLLGSKSTGKSMDVVGWYSVTHGNAAKRWPDSYEMFPVYFLPDWSVSQNGLENNMAFTRNTDSWAINAGEARCFDSDHNYYDFTIGKPISQPPHNNTDSAACVTGIAATGGVVFADDGLSSPVTAGSQGYFSLVSVATGAWTVYASSGVAFSSAAYYGGTANLFSVWMGNLRLSTNTLYGYVNGRVTGVTGVPLQNIKMYSPGTLPVFTNASGRYTLPVEAGVVTVTANYQSYNPSYVEISSMDVVVGLGEAAKDVDFSLYYGGRIRGKVTTNGVDALPGIPVVGFKGGIEQGSGISGSDGYFTISGAGVSTGTYVVVPQLEAGESATPSSTTVVLTGGATAFSSTYTVSGAYGYVTGSVTNSAGAITTGVLVYVTTSTLAAGAGPPSITPALRAGSAVYYAASSSALGTYSIPVKGGYTYNVYAWYTTWSGTAPTPATVRKESTGVAVAQNQTVTRNFNW